MSTPVYPPAPPLPDQAAAAPAAAPAGAPARGTFRVVNDVFFYTTKRGELVEIDLDIPPDVFEKSQADENGDEDAQFAAVAEWLGDDFEAIFKRMGALERVRFQATFFELWQKAAALPLGESLSSSTSSGSTAGL